MHIPKLLLILCIVALGPTIANAQRTDTDAQAKARESLRKKLAETGSQPPAAQPQQPAPVAPAAAVVPPPATPKPTVKSPVSPAPVAAPVPAASIASASAPAATTRRLSPEDEANLRNALRLKMSEPGPTPTAPGAPPPATKAGPTKARTNVVATPAQPRAPIASGVSSAKEQSLAELLSLYKANAITPDEYHKRRAQILGQ